MNAFRAVAASTAVVVVFDVVVAPAVDPGATAVVADVLAGSSDPQPAAASSTAALRAAQRKGRIGGSVPEGRRGGRAGPRALR